MGKLLVEYLVPALLLAALFYWLCKVWFLKGFQGRIDNLKKVKESSDKYDKQINNLTEGE